MACLGHTTGVNVLSFYRFHLVVGPFSCAETTRTVDGIPASGYFHRTFWNSFYPFYFVDRMTLSI